MGIESEKQLDLMKWILFTFIMMTMTVIMAIALFIIMVIEGG